MTGEKFLRSKNMLGEYADQETAALREELEEAKANISTLVDAIDTTITGMVWDSENKPECFRKADADHLEYLREVIAPFENDKTQQS